MRLKDKVAIVVGGGQQAGETVGNGRAISLKFAEHGAKVAVVDRDAASAAETVAQIEQSGGVARVYAADVTLEAQCERTVADVLRDFGHIDVLYNNVGTVEGDAMTADLPLETWHRILDINLTSAFLMSKYVLPGMRERKQGVILSTSSTASLCWPRSLTYKTSKAALNSLTEHLALDNAQYGIRANAILPGLIDTPIAIERRAEETGVSRQRLREERAARVPLAGPDGNAWDVAHAAVFLASDEARYITGVLLPIDGGMSTRRG